MTVTIRQLDLEESIKILHLLSNYAFRPTPPLPDYDAFAERLQGRNGVDYLGVFVAPMARVTNIITSLNGIPCGEGEINIKLVDPDCDWNNGNWRLSSMDDHLKISKAAKADCTLNIQGLTGLIYGVYRPDEISFRGWGEMNPKSENILERMFPPAIPFLHAMY
jgi:hypothetical protein